MAPRVAALFVYCACLVFLVVFRIRVVNVNTCSSSESCAVSGVISVCFDLRLGIGKSAKIGIESKRHHLSAPIPYYANSSACFRTHLQLLSDVSHRNLLLYVAVMFTLIQDPNLDTSRHHKTPGLRLLCLPSFGSPSLNCAAAGGLVGHVDSRLISTRQLGRVLDYSGAAFQTAGVELLPAGTPKNSFSFSSNSSFNYFDCNNPFHGSRFMPMLSVYHLSSPNAFWSWKGTNKSATPTVNYCKIVKSIQKHLNKVTAWCDLWGFKINTQKTTAVLFTHRIDKIESKLTINGIAIKVEKSA